MPPPEAAQEGWSQACLAGFITLAVTPLEPRAQHTVRLCVDRPPVATKLFRSQQFLSGGEVVRSSPLPTSGWTRCRRRTPRTPTVYPLRVEGAGSAGRGLQLGVFVDREVSPQGDGSCPGEVRS